METKTEYLSPDLVSRLDDLFGRQVLTNEKLELILTSLEKKDGRQKKKKRKNSEAVEATQTAEQLPEKHLKNVSAISYADSRRVWGEGLLAEEKKLEHSTPHSADPIFNEPAFKFKKVILQGLSLAEMAQKFPEHNWGRYGRSAAKGIAAQYLVSWENPLLDLSKKKELEARPQDCSRLDLNLTVELLLTVAALSGQEPAIFYRTTVINGHEKEMYVGFHQGKISFLPENKAKEKGKIGVCLVKDERWMY